MLTINEYLKPNSVAEAYSLLTTRDNPAIIGGGFFLRLSSRKIGTAIDLSRAGLDFIRDTGEAIEIGAMNTFRQLERSELLLKNLDGLIPAAVANLPGVQMKNMVTVGGTVYGKYGFSELLTSLLVLDCRVVLYQNGAVDLAEFLERGNTRDIVEKLIIKKQPLRASYQVFRNSAGSLPILCAAVAKNGSVYKITAGSRPGVAAPAKKAMEFLSGSTVNSATIEKAAEMVSNELEFANDRRASAEYRRELCKVLVRRALLEVQS